jgi:hypothetical protein
VRNSNLRDITPCSPVEDNRRFGGKMLLALCFMLVSYLTYPSTLKMEAICVYFSSLPCVLHVQS